jgi:hypothetical protein
MTTPTPIEQTQPTETPNNKSTFPAGLGGQLLSTYEAAQILAQSNDIRNKNMSATLNAILPQDVISFDNNAQTVSVKDVDPGQNMVLKPDGTYTETDANGKNTVNATWKMNGAGVEIDYPDVSSVIYPDGTQQDLKSWNGVLNNKDGSLSAQGDALNFSEKWTTAPGKNGSTELSLMGDKYTLNSDNKTGSVDGKQFTYQQVGDSYDITFANGAQIAVDQGIANQQFEEVTLPSDDAANGLPKGLKKEWNANANVMTLVG